MYDIPRYHGIVYYTHLSYIYMYIYIYIGAAKSDFVIGKKIV